MAIAERAPVMLTMAERAPQPARSMLIGTGLLALAILLLQVVLVRLFSVTMWYHFAFMSISLALFGAAVGGITVYLAPRFFPLLPGRAEARAAIATLLFGGSTIGAAVIHLATPFTVSLSAAGVGQLAWLYLDLAVPFFFGGLAMALLLSTYPERIGQVYFVDLLGAGLGCLLAIPALNLLGGPGAVLLVALVASASALALATAAGWGRLARGGIGVLLGILTLMVCLTPFASLLQVQYAKGVRQFDLAYEGWNFFSRITVLGDGAAGHGPPVSWALSDNFRGQNPGSRWLLIDGEAGTPIARFDGTDLAPLAYLTYDLSAMAYRLQAADAGPVLIIGPGGGRDILTARSFGRSQITAVEINPLIVETVNRHFGDYTGRPYQLPGVRTVVADARSFLAHASPDERYALIQATLIDTWASSSSGAFVLSENFLYTREAFADYYRHLADDGMMTMSRWYYRDQPAESLRLMVLTLAAWADMGVANPDQHIAMIGLERPGNPMGLATVVAKRTPFTPAEIDQLRRDTDALGFTLLYAPGQPGGSTDFGHMMSRTGQERLNYVRDYYLNIEPPSDDAPFFFNLLRPRDFLASGQVAGQSMPPNLQAVTTLIVLLGIVVVLCVLTVLLPLLVRLAQWQRAGVQPLTPRGVAFLGYAACLGLGFMFVETTLMQRFILFLGQPVYALAVILFSLLLFSGIGSWLAGRLPLAGLAQRQLMIVGAVMLGIVVYAVGLPIALQALLGLPEWGRVVATVVLIAPLGLLLGMPFPIGIRLAASRQDQALVPWAWAINGAMSVLASVGGVTLALASGFTWVFLLAAIVYGLALLLAALPLMRRRWVQQPAGVPSSAPVLN